MHERGNECISRLVRKSKGCGYLGKIKRKFEERKKKKTAKILMKNQDR
jgi:hypothetical protein